MVRGSLWGLRQATALPAAVLFATLAAAAPARAQFPDVLSETECPGCAAALQAADAARAAAVTLFVGTWSSALTSADDPGWTAEDYSCFIACTPAARASAAAPPTGHPRSQANGFELFRFACDPNGFAAQVVSPLPMRIEQQPGGVVLRYEEFGAERAITLAPGPPPKSRPTLLGTSRARLEGDALVIETTGIAAHRFYGWFAGRPHGDKLRATERYTTSENGAWLNLVLTLDDPDTLEAPLILTKRWRRVPGVEIAHYGCDVMSGQLDGVFTEYVDPRKISERLRAPASPQPTTSNDTHRGYDRSSRLARLSADPESRK